MRPTGSCCTNGCQWMKRRHHTVININQGFYLNPQQANSKEVRLVKAVTEVSCLASCRKRDISKKEERKKKCRLNKSVHFFSAVSILLLNAILLLIRLHALVVQSTQHSWRLWSRLASVCHPKEAAFLLVLRRVTTHSFFHLPSSSARKVFR